MSIKVKSLETVTTYEVDEISFFICWGMVVAITKEFVAKATVDGSFFIIMPASDQERYKKAIEECLKYGTETSFEQYEKAASAVNETIQGKIAFINEALALEGLGALVD